MFAVFAKKHRILLSSFTLFLLILCLIPPSYIKASKEDSKIYDYYQLFEEDEKQDLEETLNQYSDEGEVDIIVITTDDLEGKSKQVYMEDFYDFNALGYDKEFGDTVLLMLYMNPNDRSVEIQGYKSAEHYINNQRIEAILDEIVPFLSNGDYTSAIKKYAELAADYMKREVPAPPKSSPSDNRNPSSSNTVPNYNSNHTNLSNQYETPLLNPLYQLIASFIIGGITVGIMAYNSGGRITTNNRTYLNESNSALVAHHDIYLRTTTKRVQKPKNDDNNIGGGHTGGGTSSGGHSHSGGGRGF